MSASSVVPAPYGRSCDVCKRAKCKCMFLPGVTDRCERCSRLNKQCRQSEVKRRRLGEREGGGGGGSRNSSSVPGANAEMRRMSEDFISAGSTTSARQTIGESSTEARTARLEEKLDQVLASLSSKTRDEPVTPASNSDGAGMPSGEQMFWQKAWSTESYPQEIGPPAFAVSRAKRVWHLANVTVAEAEESLLDFRTCHAKWFPVIYIPPTTSAEHLRRDRPFLWLNIVLIASRSSAKHRYIGDVVRRELGKAMVMDSEKSLDLLLGMLVFMGWYHRHCQCVDGSVKLSLALLSQMAISLVFDLQLNRRDLKLPLHQTLGVTTHKYAGIMYPRNLEAKRAALGVFLLTSMLSLYLQRTDSLRWTPYLSDALSELQKNPECEGDTLLAHQVQLQLIVERASALNVHSVYLGSSEFAKMPASAFIQIFQTQLEEARNSFSVEMQSNDALHLHFLHNKTNINELASTLARDDTDPANVYRAQRRWSAMLVGKAWLDSFFTVPIKDYRGFSFTITTQIVHGLGALMDCATLDEPGWDKELVRREFDVLSLFDHVSRKFAQAAPLLSTGPSDNAFTIFCKFFATARASLVQRLNGVGSGASAANELEMSAADTTGFPGMFDLDFLDNELFWNFPMAQEI